MKTPRRPLIGIISGCVLLISSCQQPPPDFREANKQIVRDVYAAIDARITISFVHYGLTMPLVTWLAPRRPCRLRQASR